MQEILAFTPGRILYALSNKRRLFAQPYAPFDMGDLRVLATARRTQVRLRAAVLRKSPHLKRLCSAAGQINAALGIFECVHRRSKPLFARTGPCGRLRRCFATFPPKGYAFLRRIPAILPSPSPSAITLLTHKSRSGIQTCTSHQKPFPYWLRRIPFSLAVKPEFGKPSLPI